LHRSLTSKEKTTGITNKMEAPRVRIFV
jgi:hypothetical protein